MATLVLDPVHIGHLCTCTCVLVYTSAQGHLCTGTCGLGTCGLGTCGLGTCGLGTCVQAPLYLCPQLQPYKV